MHHFFEGNEPPIILIEDDDIDTAFVQSQLDKHKLKNPFLRAKDGVEALELFDNPIFQNGYQKPCVILLDLNLPRMNGIRLLGKIREMPTLKNSIIYILTTSARDQDIRDSYGYNIAGYILKDNAESFLQFLPQFFQFNEFSEAV